MPEAVAPAEGEWEYGGGDDAAGGAAPGAHLVVALPTGGPDLERVRDRLIDATVGEEELLLPAGTAEATPLQMIVARNKRLSAPETVLVSTLDPAIFTVDEIKMLIQGRFSKQNGSRSGC